MPLIKTIHVGQFNPRKVVNYASSAIEELGSVTLIADNEQQFDFMLASATRISSRFRSERRDVLWQVHRYRDGKRKVAEMKGFIQEELVK